MSIKTNSGLKLYMESAIGVAKTITAITKAAPGVVSSTGHGFIAGDTVLLEIQGMVELNGKLVKVGTVPTVDSFQIAGVDGSTGVDTTLYSTFSSGTATSTVGVVDKPRSITSMPSPTSVLTTKLWIIGPEIRASRPITTVNFSLRE